jgi:hypothetical protein
MMSHVNKVGRLVGTIVLVQLIGEILTNFFLTAPLFGSPGFMVNGAIYSQQIGLAVLLGLAMSGLSIALATILFPVFREYNLPLALWLVVLAGVGLAVAVLENIGMMSLVSYSEAYAVAAAADRELLEVARTIVTSTRNWAHYLNLILSGCFLLVLYSNLYLSRLIPRLLSGFGCVAVLLQLISVSLPLFGQDVIFPMMAPLGLSQIALALWLIVKGFNGAPLLENRGSE